MKKILIVDDNDDVLKLVQDTLAPHSFQCITALTAMEGLQKATEEKPQLVLLDLMLPKMSGLGFMREIKNHADLKNIPVVAFTSLGDEDVAREVMELGAVGYLRKSCSTQELLTMIREYAL